MTRLTTHRARFIAAAALALLFISAFAPAARAQRCPCDHINVIVDAGVGCAIELHPAAPLCRFAPVIVTPGTTTQIACCDDMMLTIVACDHSDPTFSLAAGATCFTRIPIQTGCCVNACSSIDANGCPQIIIRPGIKCPIC